MGFFDSFKKGFEEENNKIQDIRGQSDYETVVQKDAAKYKEYNLKNDGELIRLHKASYLSENDKKTIERILRGRGYNHDNKGFFKGVIRT